MPTVPLHPRLLAPSSTAHDANPLPPLLRTPSGLALVELQGDIRFPPAAAQASTQVGKLVFPLYRPDINGEGDPTWMKRVYLYVGVNQRMAGEVKKLGRPFAVIRRREPAGSDHVAMGDAEAGSAGEELEIVEIVKYKILFATRPEPVGGGVEETA
jgi:chromosome transmission fidelity protein 8